jgi:hypothetical protein
MPSLFQKGARSRIGRRREILNVVCPGLSQWHERSRASATSPSSSFTASFIDATECGDLEKPMNLNRVEVPMQRSFRSIALVTTALALGACSTFQPRSAVEMKPADATLNSSWHARIASPSDLSGALQMNGSASMAPGVRRGTTQVTMNIGNTSPGGVHPWAIHLGQCGEDEGVFGALEDYPPLTIGANGMGTSRATVALVTPSTGDYFVSVQASAANRELTVACGNLAAPTS